VTTSKFHVHALSEFYLFCNHSVLVLSLWNYKEYFSDSTIPSFELFLCCCKGLFCPQRCGRMRCPIPKQNEKASLESIGYEANFQNSCCSFHHDSTRILFLNVAQFTMINFFLYNYIPNLNIVDETSFTSSMYYEQPLSFINSAF
jgi:hypothetical protein